MRGKPNQRLRAIFKQPPSPTGWTKVCKWLEGMEVHVRDAELLRASKRLESWPDEMRVASFQHAYEWTETPPCWWPLVRTLSYVASGPGNPLGPEGAKALVSSPHMANLTRLRLEQGDIGKEGAKALASSPYMENLTHLYLEGNVLEEEGARILAASPYLMNLSYLDLHENGAAPDYHTPIVTYETLLAFAHNPSVGRLELLGSNDASTYNSAVLLELAYLPGLERIHGYDISAGVEEGALFSLDSALVHCSPYLRGFKVGFWDKSVQAACGLLLGQTPPLNRKGASWKAFWEEHHPKWDSTKERNIELVRLCSKAHHLLESGKPFEACVPLQALEDQGYPLQSLLTSLNSKLFRGYGHVLAKYCQVLRSNGRNAMKVFISELRDELDSPYADPALDILSARFFALDWLRTFGFEIERWDERPVFLKFSSPKEIKENVHIAFSSFYDAHDDAGFAQYWVVPASKAEHLAQKLSDANNLEPETKVEILFKNKLESIWWCGVSSSYWLFPNAKGSAYVLLLACD